MKNSNKEKVVRTTVWSAGPGCHGGCGAKLYVKNGCVVKIEGDENHPWNQGRLCVRALATTQYMYHPDRITHPLKRVGKRGEGKWEQITWEEAFDICEKKLREIRDEYGAESVIFAQGTGRDIGGPITMLMYAYGSPNWVNYGLSGHCCYSPRQVAMFATQGDYCVADCSQFLEKRYKDPAWVVPEVIIVWAQSVTASDPDAFYGHWIIDCMKRGSKIIAIDPRTPWLATRATLHLPLRPGTDGALALGMLNVIIREDLYNKEFVEKWCYGFEELKKRVSEYPPEKVAQITWLSEKQIIEAARLYAKSKPAAIHWGVPIDMNAEGAVVAQAINALWAITGNVDNPGGNVIARPSHGVTSYPYYREEMIKLYGKELFSKLAEKRISTDRYPAFKKFRGWAQPDIVLEQIENGHPYPIKGAWMQSINALSCMAADPKRHLAALKKLDFIAVVDLFMTPTAQALGDVFLPAATFPEKESLRSWWAPLSVIVKAVEVSECKSDWEINLELAKRLSLQPFPYRTVKDLLNARLKTADKSYDELAQRGSWEMPPEGASKPYFRYERGLLRADGKPGFNTPTGKVELFSKFWEECGLDPLPYYEEAAESPYSTPVLLEEYPLIMGTGVRSPALFHSEHRQIPWLREIEPQPFVEINPVTAMKLGIISGDWVRIENARGKIKAVARVTPIVPAYMVMVGHGWWLPESEGKAPGYYNVWETNVNNLIPMGTQGRCGYGGGSYKTCLCKITKIA